MATLHIAEQNKQATVHIPKDLVDALGWKNNDRLLVSKPLGQRYLIIENIDGEKRQK